MLTTTRTTTADPTRLRARISTENGRTFVRFFRIPPREIRDALKQQGAQFLAHRSAWVLPAPAGAA